MSALDHVKTIITATLYFKVKIQNKSISSKVSISRRQSEVSETYSTYGESHLDAGNVEIGGFEICSRVQ
jgi:hypothetical protein